MRPYLRLIRAGNVGVSLIGTIVGGLAARGAGVFLPEGTWAFLVLAAFSTACVTAAGNVLNDLGDRETDRVNHPDRPLVTGAISVPAARRTMFALFAVSAVLVAPVVLSAPLVAAILVSALLAVFAYERRLKSGGLTGNAAVAYLTAAVFLYGGAAAGNPLAIVPFAAMAFGATLSREIIKDMEDARGDVDRKTFARTRGLAPASAAARVAAGAAIALSLAPFLTLLSLDSLAGIMYLAFVLAADALFVVSVLWLPERLHREQGTSKAAMTVALLAFAATAFR